MVRLGLQNTSGNSLTLVSSQNNPLVWLLDPSPVPRPSKNASSVITCTESLPHALCLGTLGSDAHRTQRHRLEVRAPRRELTLVGQGKESPPEEEEEEEDPAERTAGTPVLLCITRVSGCG